MADPRPSIQTIFSEAIERDSQEKIAAFLDKACSGDAAMRDRVEALLRAHSDAGGFFAGDARVAIAENLWGVDVPIGAQIGPYKLREIIGEGGMGVVYVAEQERPVRRKVALKIIRPGMATKDVVARFEAERQALAMMDHPNIARVFDAGTTNVDRSLRERDGSRSEPATLDPGQPYFVMELVQGPPITEYCDEHRLSTRDRLKLFLKACRAVHHAHQKGIIHRDLKPSNILVAEIDGAAVPKVIDFGVAKATSAKLTEQTVYTQFSQLVGTPLYMSPEQAGLGVIDVDTRSDVYSLGVLLYELLTGSTPFDREALKRADHDELRRIIREDPPRRPSAMISTLAAEALSTVAALRGSDPRTLSFTLRGELDWLVMKCLEKDRNRRYETATALADDINRYLNDEPVQARAPTAAYRVRKFARRNRTGVAVATLVLLSLVGGVIGTSIQWYRAEQLAEESERQREDAEVARDDAESALTLSRTLRLISSESYRDKRPVQNLVMAIEAVEGTRRNSDMPHPLALEVLLNANAVIAGEPLGEGRANFDDVAMSPDGSSFATTSPDGTVRIWSMADEDRGSLLHELQGHSDQIKAILFSPDSKWLATSSIDGTVRLWDVSSSKPSATMRTFQGHDYGLQTVDFSPASDLLVAGGPVTALSGDRRDGTVFVCDLRESNSAKSLRILRGHEDIFLSSAFSRDGRWLFTGSRDKTVRIWDLRAADPSLSARVEHLDAYVTHVEVSPNGKRFATGLYGGSGLQIWDLAEDGGITRTLHFGDTAFSDNNYTIFSPDNRWCAYALTSTGDIVLSDLASRDPLAAQLVVAPGGRVKGFSRDGRWLLAGSRILDIEADDPASSAIPLTGGHDGSIRFALSPDGKWIVSASPVDGTARLWDLSRQRPGHSKLVLVEPRKWKFGISSNSRYLGTISKKDSHMRLWELTDDGPVPAPFDGDDEPIEHFTFGPKSLRLYTVGPQGTIKIWNLSTPHAKRPLVGLPGNTEEMFFFVVSRDGRWLATSSEDSTVRLWDLQEPDLAAPSHVLHNVFANTLAISRNGRWLITCKRYEPYVNAPTKLWDLHASDIASSSVPLPGQSSLYATFQCVLSPNARWLVTGSEDSAVRRYDLAAPNPVATEVVLESQHPVRSLAIDSDGTQLFVGRWYQQDCELWDVTSRKPDPTDDVQWLRPIASAAQAAISPNGRWLAVGSDDANVHLWKLDAATEREFTQSHMVLKGHEGVVEVVLFSPNGRWLVTSDGDTTRVWDLDVDNLLARARRFAGRGLTEEERQLFMLPIQSPNSQTQENSR